ncbi:MAG: TnpV protein [Clostridia bacterium]|nr:TnpV protein [Clostridia bacterium]
MEEIKYLKNGDYLIPDLKLTQEETKPLGKYGRMRRDFLKKNNPALFSSLSLSGKLWQHLSETDESANRYMEDLMQSLKEKNGITEELKSRNPMIWTQMMNNLKSQAEEIIMKEIIFS